MARDRIFEHVPRGEMMLDGVEVQVGRVSLKYGDPYVVRLVVSSREPLRTVQVDELKRIITDRMGTPIVLEVQTAIRR